MGRPSKTAGFAVRRRCAGGMHSKIVLMLQYRPRAGKGRPRWAKSNDPRYAKTWDSVDQITMKDEEEFRSWVENDFAAGGGSKPKEVSPVEMHTLSSERMSVRTSDKVAVDDDALRTEIKR